MLFMIGLGVCTASLLFASMSACRAPLSGGKSHGYLTFKQLKPFSIWWMFIFSTNQKGVALFGAVLEAAQAKTRQADFSNAGRKR